jgi:hypothetical protein
MIPTLLKAFRIPPQLNAFKVKSEGVDFVTLHFE